MKNIRLNIIYVALVLPLLVGCVNNPTKLDQHFGDATRSMMQSQVIDPQAGMTEKSMAPLDGRSAREVIYNYYESYNKPTANPNSFSIRVGNGGSNGMAGNGAQ